MVRFGWLFAMAALLPLAACGGEEERAGDEFQAALAAGLGELDAAKSAAGESSDPTPAQASFLMIALGPGPAQPPDVPVLKTRSSGEAQSSPDPIPARPLGCDPELTDRCDDPPPPKP